LRELAGKVPWFYTGDVSVEIEWTVHVRTRYESHKSVDIDNIAKPILDGVSGIGGCLIDDSQVQHVSVYWTTWTREDREHLRITIRSNAPDLTADRALVMVEIRPGLCLPMETFESRPGLRRSLLDLSRTSSLSSIG
jgi:hypothetical protein